MKDSKVLKAILVISGLIGAAVGASLLFTPIALYASVGNDVTGMVSLLSDLRATGGSLLILGILIALGAFVARLAYTSTLLATVLYLSYGTARVYGFSIDGMPGDVIVQVTILELVIGLVCLGALVKYREAT